jgi:hypothetical protein
MCIELSVYGDSALHNILHELHTKLRPQNKHVKYLVMISYTGVPIFSAPFCTPIVSWLIKAYKIESQKLGCSQNY